MKQYFLVFLLLITVTVLNIPVISQQPRRVRQRESRDIKQAQFAEGELLVKFYSEDDSVTRQSLTDFSGAVHRQVRAKVIKEFRHIPQWQLVRLPDGMNVDNGIKAYNRAFNFQLQRFRSTLRQTTNIRMLVERDLIIKIPDDEIETTPPDRTKVPTNMVERAAPNDPDINRLWGLNNTGQVSGCTDSGGPHTGGIADADIDAFEAWDKWTGSRETVIAVIDTGVQYTHPDLAANMWRNPGEIAGNGRDDDTNGVIDDVHGFDAGSQDGNPMDVAGHGTHCAGTIGALGNNGVGVSGVNQAVSIMAVRIPLSRVATGPGAYESRVSRVMGAFEYVIMMKTEKRINIRVTSNSWTNGGCGPDAFSQAQKDAIDAAGAAGIVNVIAAANASNNNDTCPYYPASYRSPSIISVAASNSADNKPGFSNWGRTTVHLAAPGRYILSTVINGYGCAGGTSMATPHVAGAVALLSSYRPVLTVEQLKDIILRSVDPLPSSWTSTPLITNGRLNIAKALDIAGGTNPQPIGNGRIVFVSDRDGNREIYVMNADGSNQTRLTNNPADDYNPVWSPDGRKIVFVSNRDGNPEIYVMNADGTEQINISNSASKDENPSWGTGTPSPTPTPSPSPGPGNFSIDRHVNTTLSDDTADQYLADGIDVLRTVDGAGDVSTTVNLRRNGFVGTFNVGDGIVNTIAEKDAIFALRGNVHAVTDLQACGNTINPSIIGCSGSNLPLLVEVLDARRPLDGILWVHEYGHNRSLSHRNVAFAVMHETIGFDHRRVNQFEHDRYIVPLLTRVADGEKIEQPTDRQKDIKDFVRRLYPEGISYMAAKNFTKSEVPILLEMLSDRNEELYWTNIVTTLGMIGDSSAVEGLIRFLERSERGPQVTISEYKAKLAVLPALGYILAKKENERALVYLRDGLTPEVWSQRVLWRGSAGFISQEPNRILVEMAIWGLALSGRPEAGRILERTQTTIAREKEKFSTETEQVLKEARAAHTVIDKSGLDGYYKQ